MKIKELRKKVEKNLFSLNDVRKSFPEENEDAIKQQLSRFTSKGSVSRLKRGLYCFELSSLDEFYLANELYSPSYVSLESALDFYHVIPDVPQSVTSVNPITTKEIKNRFGVFYYHKLKKDLFWGFVKKEMRQGKGFFKIARKEKALLDFFYLRGIESAAGLRLDLSDFDFGRYEEYCKAFPKRVQSIKIGDEQH